MISVSTEVKEAPDGPQRSVTGATIDDARKGTENEHRMTLVEAVRLYPKAIAWSMLISLSIVMEGFDIVLIGAFYAFPQFTEKFGVLQPDGTYEVPASWQSALINAAQGGQFVGVFLNGFIAERFGYRKTTSVACAALVGFIFIAFFAPNIKVLLVAEILMGIPWGMFQTLTVTYAAEVCPVQLRAHLEACVNLGWVVGQLIASIVLRALLNNPTQWAVRIPYALQWVWPLPILVGMIWCPESPWWLIRQNRLDDAKRALLRLTSSPVSSNDVNEDNATFSIDETIAMMVHTNEMEKRVTEGTSFFDCFKDVDRRRTEIVCAAWAIQNVSGQAFTAFAAVLYQRAGLDTAHSFDMSAVQNAIGCAATMASWFLLQRTGRRPIYLWGLTIMIVLLLAIGLLGVFAESKPWAPWTIASLLLVYIGMFNLTTGPVVYCVGSEVPSTRLRGKTVVLGLDTFLGCSIVTNVLTSYQLSTTAWDWGAKTGLFWAGISLICLAWCYFRLPECKGRTYGEIDVLFERRVPARRFAETYADAFDDFSVPAREKSVEPRVHKDSVDDEK